MKGDVKRMFSHIGEYVEEVEGTAANLFKKNPYDAGFDIRASEDVIIKPWKKALVSTGVRVSIPRNCVGILKSRSGLASKHDIEVGSGVIDSGYIGEIKVLLRNFGDEEFIVSKGNRIAQLLTVNIEVGWYQKVDKLPKTTRGEDGFGSTGI